MTATTAAPRRTPPRRAPRRRGQGGGKLSPLPSSTSTVPQKKDEPAVTSPDDYKAALGKYDAYASAGSPAAKKLADSAVAPVVVAARNYSHVSSSRDFKYRLKETIGVDLRSSQWSKVQDSFDEGHDVLFIPWFSITQIGAEHPQPSEYQWRPSKPRVGKGGKPVKYETRGKKDETDRVLPLDIHPSTPQSWLDDAPTVLVAEGALKGDAALSAYLAQQGAGAELLSSTSAYARKQLREFMEKIPVEDRVLIVRASSVTTLTSDPVLLRTLDFAGREVWIGVDGDVSTNPKVWRQTKQFWSLLERSKAGQVKLLAPRGEHDAKDGIDDFLSHTGNWSDLTEHLSDELPVTPDDGIPAYQWRISECGTFCEHKVPSKEDGEITGYRWEPTGVDFGAQITNLSAQRYPTAKEMRSGVLDPGLDAKNHQAEILVKWQEGEDQIRSALITMPANLLHENPTQWNRGGANIPPRFAVSVPSWPLTREQGHEFLQAVTRNSAEVTERVLTMRNGWVPTESGTGAFIIGETILTTDGESASSLGSAIDHHQVHGYEKFGIGGPSQKHIPHPNTPLGQWTDQEENGKWLQTWKPLHTREASAKRTQIREDTTRLRELLFDDQPFASPAVSALILAAAMRPLLLAPPSRATLQFYGEKGSGKTTAARTCMHFWASEAVDYIGQTSGSPMDTPSTHEINIARMPIWLMDDLAPSQSKNDAQYKEQKVADIVRSVFNQTIKGRSNQKLEALEQNLPYAQLLITAENPLKDASANERSIRIPFNMKSRSPYGMGPIEAIEAAAAEGLFARTTLHFAEWMLHRIQTRGWEQVRSESMGLLRDQTSLGRERLLEHGAVPKGVGREAVLAAEMTAALQMFAEFLKDAGIVWDDLMAGTIDELSRSDDGEVQELLHTGSKDEVETGEAALSDQLCEAVYEHIAEQSVENKASSPGERLLAGIRALLETGKVHIDCAKAREHAPTAMPGIQNDEKSGLNANLGWTWRDGHGDLVTPHTSRIGSLFRDNQGDLAVIFLKAPTVDEVKKYTSMLNDTEDSTTLWRSLIDAGLHDSHVALKDSQAKTSSQWRVRAQGKTSITGVAIKLSTLLGE